MEVVRLEGLDDWKEGQEEGGLDDWEEGQEEGSLDDWEEGQEEGSLDDWEEGQEEGWLREGEGGPRRQGSVDALKEEKGWESGQQDELHLVNVDGD